MKVPLNYEEFGKSLELAQPPALWPESLQALWWAAKGNWENAHEIAQDIPSKTGSWIHAYLHRVEGDRWNAGYWYDRANKPFSKHSAVEELEQIISSVLKNEL